MPTLALGKALAASSRGLVYGGGSKGIMGLVSGAVLEGGGDVTGVVPVAMVAAGGEGNTSGAGGSSKEDKVNVILNEKGREKVRTEIIIKAAMLKGIATDLSPHVDDLGAYGKPG